MDVEQIQGVPSDGASFILYDEAKSRYEVASWSSADSAWVRDDGRRIGIEPTHWMRFPDDSSPVGNFEGRRRLSRDAFAGATVLAGIAFFLAWQPLPSIRPIATAIEAAWDRFGYQIRAWTGSFGQWRAATPIADPERPRS
jgi:hypothetical protein